MKTINASFHQNLKLQSIATKILVPAMAASLRDIMTLTWTALTAIAIIALSVWAAGMEIRMYLGVSTWGVGFIFLALAVDNHGRLARYQMLTGVALLSLALLQNSVSPVFFILSGVLLAAWVAGIVFKRMSV